MLGGRFIETLQGYIMLKYKQRAIFYYLRVLDLCPIHPYMYRKLPTAYMYRAHLHVDLYNYDVHYDVQEIHTLIEVLIFV